MPRIVLALLLASCSTDPGRPTTPVEHATLAALVVECRGLVRANCERVDGLPVAECPVLVECDRRIEAWGKP